MFPIPGEEAVAIPASAPGTGAAVFESRAARFYNTIGSGLLAPLAAICTAREFA